MQQCLKNGFVAATDDGVWYLQDGFEEWVNLGGGSDTILGIAASNTNIYISPYRIDAAVGKGYHKIYGNNIYEVKLGVLG